MSSSTQSSSELSSSSDSDYKYESDDESTASISEEVKPRSKKTPISSKKKEKYSTSTEEESEEEKDPFSCIDVHTNDMVVGARGSEIAFLSPTGQMTNAYDAKYSDNKLFSPTKLLFHSDGEKLLTLTPKKNVICRFDTESGKNIGQVNVKLFHEDVNARIETIVPLQKFSHIENQNELSLAAICGNSFSKIHWDSRVPVVKDYVLNPTESVTRAKQGFKFTAITTTKEGHVAVAARDGTIRLYTAGDEIKRAKTELSQLADPIIGLDVSANGEWLLGTTTTYLIVFKTIWENRKGEHSAFKENMPSKQKQVLVLRIPPEDIEKYKIKNISLTPARFDPSPFQGDPDIIEEEIVTSTGSFIIRFKFRKVKLDYKRDRRQERAKPIIYKQEEDIVDKTFSYKGDCIVAALCHDLKKIDLEDKK